MKTLEWDGKIITKPGCYSGIPLETYHSQLCDGPSVSSSNLRRVLERNGGSPAHMFAEWSGNPRREKGERASEALTIGRATHHLMLGEPNFREHFAVRPPQFDSWRTNAAKEWRQKAEEIGFTIMTMDDIGRIKGMSKALSEALLFPEPGKGGEPIRIGEELLGGPHIERSFIWKDKTTGLWVKARPDCGGRHEADFSDLKTTTSVQYNDLVRTITDYAYHQQAALTAEGAIACGAEYKITDVNFRFVFIESRSPYCVRPILVRPDDLMRGVKQNMAARAIIAQCIKQNRWPGPGGNRWAIEQISLPDWYTEAADAEVERILK